MSYPTTYTLVFIATSLALAACTGQGSAPAAAPVASAQAAAVNQTDLCETHNWRSVPDCKPGQKVVFTPERFGNEQLPVMFAAANCDLRYSVVSTVGAVTCIYYPFKPSGSAQAAAAASAPASAASSGEH